MTFSDLTRFDGKTAVVTGGVRGLGRAMADALAEQGADVHVFDWTDPTDEDKAGPLSFYKVDVSKSASVNEAVASLPNPATLLISNAGITRDTTIRKMDDDMWQAVIEIGLGLYYVFMAAVQSRHMAMGAVVTGVLSLGLFTMGGATLRALWIRHQARREALAEAAQSPVVRASLAETVPEELPAGV